jgi:hypothetical protein
MLPVECKSGGEAADATTYDDDVMGLLHVCLLDYIWVSWLLQVPGLEEKLSYSCAYIFLKYILL